MIYIESFDFIEEIASKGLDEAYKDWDFDAHILETHTEGVKAECFQMTYVGNGIEVFGQKTFVEQEIVEEGVSFLHGITKDGVRPYGPKFLEYLIENKYTNSKTVYDYYCFPGIKGCDMWVRHVENNILSYSNQTKYELFFKIIFDESFESVRENLECIIKSRPKNGESSNIYIYEIFKAEKYLKRLLKNGKYPKGPKYKQKVYDYLIEKVDDLFSHLKNRFPLLYEELMDKYPLDFQTNKKLIWNVSNDTFFYLFNQLKQKGIIQNSRNSKISYEELAQNLMQSFQITPENGEKLQYEPQSFVEKLKNPITKKNAKLSEKVNPVVNQLITELLLIK